MPRQLHQLRQRMQLRPRIQRLLLQQHQQLQQNQLLELLRHTLLRMPPRNNSALVKKPAHWGWLF